ncbi:tetratricopeptide repeat protein [Chitinophaga sp. XS-30]|uniref:tetratricopeptide repeat protein n=1 Tax=Chitinophaga sp. XS-30 TaxID=2604421 RepID=UPI0011DCEA1F|nr:tetratricopeptide repeat protein [Chitinophaga sp. XS-30]QEH40040.1 tetratricopeptide repeat protein [Chitinophaga sp. XS-30]
MTRSFIQPIMLAAVCLLSCITLQAQDTALFREANQLYREQEYRAAAAKYQQLIDSGYQVADLYFNAGNAYYKSNQTGMAVYSFEKALNLNPGDDAIEHNLQLANLQVNNTIESLPMLFFERWWLQWQQLHTAAGWAIGTIVLFWLCCAGAMAYFFIPRFQGNPYIRWSATAFAVLFIGYFSMAVWMHNKAYNSGVGIVLKTVKVKAAPDDGGKDLFDAQEGVKVHLLDATSEYCKIELADGKTGWIAVADVKEL